MNNGLEREALGTEWVYPIILPAQWADLQAWLAANEATALRGWPALQGLRQEAVLDARGLSDHCELLVDITTWRILTRPGVPAPPAGLPLQIEVSERPEPWREVVKAWLADEPIRALAVAVLSDGGFVGDAEAVADAEQGRLRWQTGWPRKGENGLSLTAALRWPAIAAWTGLQAPHEVVRGLRRDPASWLLVERPMWRQVLHTVLLGPHAGMGLQLLSDIGALSVMVPEVTAMAGFHKSCPLHHKDIWNHTLEVVEKCPPRLVVRWSALMHDTGKVLTRSLRGGKVHFFGHEAVGALLMEGVAARLQLPSDLCGRVTYVIAHHARANAYLNDWTDSAVRRLVRELGVHLADVLAFSRSDWTTKRAGRIAEVKGLTAELAVRIPEMIAEAQRVPPLPKGLGTYVLEQTKLQAGPWLGRIQLWLEAECDEGRLEALREPEYYLQALRDKAPELLAITPGTERQRRM